MAVLLPNCTLTAHARSHAWTRDDWGTPAPSPADTITTTGPYPGHAIEAPDGSWELRMDTRHGELRQGDEVTDGTRTWVVAAQPSLHLIPGHPAVDHLAVVGTLNPPRVA